MSSNHPKKATTKKRTIQCDFIGVTMSKVTQMLKK